MNFRERGLGLVDWIHLAQERQALVNMIMNPSVPKKIGIS
jgi:hypothetical protein